MLVHERLLRTDPSYANARVASENRAWEAELTRSPLVGRSGVTIIPVVVHVVYRTAQENISEAQIMSQVEVLNRDFRKTNPDVSATPAAFAMFAADARIEFELASTDPDGNATDGITRTETAKTGFTDNNDVKKASTGGADAWPADKYLNLWVCKLSGTLLGYAQFPGGPAWSDGVVITHTAVGTTGTAAPPFNLGRTATHEIGHWLNLRHIWGDDGNGCNGDDFIADTPNAAGSNTGMPAFPHVTCNNGPNGDMFMNYMDYTDDAGMFMFTSGQVTRMQAALDGDRSTIGHPKPGVATLKFRDDPVGPTLKFRDDGGGGPTLKIADDNVTLKFRDDGPATLKALDDGPGTLKVADDGGTLKFRDDGGTSPAFDPIKQPGFDKPPAGDTVKGPASDVAGPMDPGFPVAGPAPFILSAPHHSMAWMRSFPTAAEGAVARAEAQLLQYEQLFEQYAAAESAGQLAPEDYASAEQLYNEYAQLVEEYQQLVGR